MSGADLIVTLGAEAGGVVSGLVSVKLCVSEVVDEASVSCSSPDCAS